MGATPGLPGGILSAATPPLVTIVRPAKPKGPVLVSSGVAAGLLLSPIQPHYPEIAQAARIQGTVVIEATISRRGTIENLRVIEGQPMLRQAAVDAVAAAKNLSHSASFHSLEKYAPSIPGTKQL